MDIDLLQWTSRDFGLSIPPLQFPASSIHHSLPPKKRNPGTRAGGYVRRRAGRRWAIPVGRPSPACPSGLSTARAAGEPPGAAQRHRPHIHGPPDSQSRTLAWRLSTTKCRLLLVYIQLLDLDYLEKRGFLKIPLYIQWCIIKPPCVTISDYPHSPFQITRG